MYRTALPLALLLAATAAPLRAQEADAVAVGARVRVSRAAPPAERFAPARRPPPPVVGTLLVLDTALVAVGPHRGDPVFLPRAEVTRLDVSAGPGPCGGPRRVACALAGMAVGAFVVGKVGHAMSRATIRSCSDGCWAETSGLVVGGAIGGLIGLRTGSLVGRERWREVPIPPAAAGAAAARSGAG